MHYVLLLLFGCEPASGISMAVEVQDSGISVEPSAAPAAEPTSQPSAEPSSAPTSEPTAEPSATPTSEPSQAEPTTDPTSEPSQEEPPPPIDFSDFVEDEVGLERGTSGLDTIESDLTLWLDASKTSTITKDNDNLVSQWDNRSDFADHATQSELSARPIYDGSDQMLLFNGGQVLFVENQSVDISTTYFVVYKGGGPVGTLFAKSNRSGNWSRGGKSFFIRNGKYTTDVGWVGYFTANSSVSTTSASIATFVHQENGVQDGFQIHYNGNLEIDSSWEYTKHAESELNNGIFKIGYTSNNFPENSGLQGKIAEMIKIDQNIDDTLRMMIHSYLASKWGIAAEVDSDGDGTTDDSDTNPFDPAVQ